jgi:hypothetical protein
LLVLTAEYVAATHAVKEAIWLCMFVRQVFGGLAGPTTLCSDNKLAIALTNDHQFHTRTKHINIRFHFIRWVIDDGHIKLIYCPTENMVADTFTKVLLSAKVKHFTSVLGLEWA